MTDLEIRPNIRTIVLHVDALRLKCLSRPDSGDQQQLRGGDCSSRNDNLFLGDDTERRATPRLLKGDAVDDGMQATPESQLGRASVEEDVEVLSRGSDREIVGRTRADAATGRGRKVSYGTTH